MTSRFKILIVFMLASFSHASFALEKVAKRPFLVEDSISMVRIIDPDVSSSAYVSPIIKISSDGKYFVVATRKGNLATGKNDYSLILYKMEQVAAFLKQNDGQEIKSNLPKGKILIQVSTRLNEAAFQKVAWLKGRNALAFIGWFDTQDGESSGQVYKLDIHSRVLRKLTNHPRPIISFAVNDVSKKIIYASTIPRHNRDSTKTSYLAGVRQLNEILDPNWESPVPAVQYYLQELDYEGNSQTVGQTYHGFFPTDIWLSPNGHWAVILSTRKDPPKHWLNNYDYLKSDFFDQVLKGFDENTMIRREDILTQFSLIDIGTGKIRPVFDAPTGLYVGGYGVAVSWSPDSNSIILANTALPVNIADRKIRIQRSQSFATVEYNINTGTITQITNHQTSKNYRNRNKVIDNNIKGGLFKSLAIISPGILKIEEFSTDFKEKLPDKFFAKKNGRWFQTTTPSISNIEKSKRNLEITIFQNLNSAPEIMARDRSTGNAKIITDFNPQFRDLTFGTAKPINWRDKRGRNWQGGLVYPPGYKVGKKYALVIQTHGFFPQEFLIDGPNDVANTFSAQALANKDIMVLQLADPSAPQDRNELFIFQNGFESAIDYLDSKGLIDRKKVGIIGWSSTGVDIQHMLLYSDYPIAAATIADSYNFGLFGYVNQFGRPAPAMAFIEDMNGGVAPWGKNLMKWVTNDPTLHLDRLKTPLRYEQYQSGVSSWWGTYTMLKRQQKPVEYYIFNDAAHALIKPAHRMASQQGTVDWFTFWLKGEEYPDPAKANQYKRWRKLRVQQKKSVSTINKIRGN